MGVKPIILLVALFTLSASGRIIGSKNRYRRATDVVLEDQIIPNESLTTEEPIVSDIIEEADIFDYSDIDFSGEGSGVRSTYKSSKILVRMIP